MSTAAEAPQRGALTFQPPTTPPGLKVLLYGPSGVGKTTGALSAPGPILLLNAEGPDGPNYARQEQGRELHEVTVTGYGSLEAAYFHLRDRRGDEPTVVVDSLGEVYRVLLEDLSGKAIRPTLPQYGEATVRLERFCRSLRDLPHHVVWVAGERPIKDEETGGFERLPITGTTNPDLGQKVMAMATVTGYCGYLPPEGGAEAKGRWVAQLYHGHGRRGKDRTGRLNAAGGVLDVNLAAWVEQAGRPLNPLEA
jgi:AAA domain-containing protein